MTPRYWTDVPDVPGDYFDGVYQLTRDEQGHWRRADGWPYDGAPERGWFFGPLPTAYDEAADLDQNLHAGAGNMLAEAMTEAGRWRNQFNAFRGEWAERFGFLATTNPPDSFDSIDEVAKLLGGKDPAADLDRACKVAFAEMYAAYRCRSPVNMDYMLLADRFANGERSPDLRDAMRELTGRMQQSPANG